MPSIAGRVGCSDCSFCPFRSKDCEFLGQYVFMSSAEENVKRAAQGKMYTTSDVLPEISYGFANVNHRAQLIFIELYMKRIKLCVFMYVCMYVFF